MTSDASLVIFTLLVQWAVGTCLVREWVPRLAGDSKVLRGIESVEAALWWAVVGASLVAALVSFFHLGSFAQAVLSLSNLQHSWLSREILFELVFIAGTGMCAVLATKGSLDQGPARILTGATALMGLLLVVCMSALYLVPAAPAWNQWTTPVSFLGTTLLLGTLTLLAINPAATRADSGLLGFAIAVLVIGLLSSLVLYHNTHHLCENSPLLGCERLPAAFALSSARVCVGAGLGIVLALLWWVGRTKKMNRRRWLLVSVLGLALGGELLGRLAFFASHLRIGV